MPAFYLISFLIGLACLYACQSIMVKKNRSAMAGRLLGFFLGPIGVVICLLMSPA